MSARDPIPTGLVYGMPNADYHRMPALSASGVKLLRRSPAHFYGQILDPLRPRSEPSPAMNAGTLAHCAILEPDKMAERYIVKPDDVDMRTKAGKEWAASIPVGLDVVTEDQWLTADRQARAVRQLPEVGKLFDQGHAEVSGFWTDAKTGSACKVRPDWVSPAGDGVLLLDVKTAKDASPQAFPRAAFNFGYHLQAAWYSEGFMLASGLPVLGFVFVVVESDYPHQALAYVMDEGDMQAARLECRRLLDLYADCMASNKWPGYTSGVQILKLPAWATTPEET